MVPTGAQSADLTPTPGPAMPFTVTFSVATGFRTAGVVTVGTQATLAVTGGSARIAALTNDGQFTLSGSAEWEVNDDNVSNNGTMDLNGGEFRHSAANALLTNTNAFNVNGGDHMLGQVFNTGHMNFMGGSVSTDDDFENEPGGVVEASGTSSVDVGGNFLNGGQFTLSGGAEWEVDDGNVSNHGTMDLNGGEFRHTAPNGILVNTNELNLIGGIFNGQNVNNQGGMITVDNAILTVNEALTLGDGSDLFFHINGTTRGSEYGSIDAGTARLINDVAGTAIFDFTPMNGDFFDLLVADLLVGLEVDPNGTILSLDPNPVFNINTFNVLGLNPGFMWSLDYVTENQREIIRLTINGEPIVDPPNPPDDGGGQAAPEPLTATLGLMGLGVLGMATRRRAA